MPRTLTSILRQKLSSLRMVANATSWGVVTTTAPSGRAFLSALTTVRCSSDVPGGVSSNRADARVNNFGHILRGFSKETAT